MLQGDVAGETKADGIKTDKRVLQGQANARLSW
jgi:hypothetical protein